MDSVNYDENAVAAYTREKKALEAELKLKQMELNNSEEEQDAVLTVKIEQARCEVEEARRYEVLVQAECISEPLVKQEREGRAEKEALQVFANEWAANVDVLLSKVCVLEKLLDDLEEPTAFFKQRLRDTHRNTMAALQSEHQKQLLEHTEYLARLEEERMKVGSHKHLLHALVAEKKELSARQFKDCLSCVEGLQDQALDTLSHWRRKVTDKKKRGRELSVQILSEPLAFLSDLHIVEQLNAQLEEAIFDCRTAVWRAQRTKLGQERKHMWEKTRDPVLTASPRIQISDEHSSSPTLFLPAASDVSLLDKRSIARKGSVPFTTDGASTEEITRMISSSPLRYERGEQNSRVGILAFTVTFKGSTPLLEMPFTLIATTLQVTCNQLSGLLIARTPTVMPHFTASCTSLSHFSMQGLISLESTTVWKTAHERAFHRIALSPAFLTVLNRKLGTHFEKAVVGEPTFAARVENSVFSAQTNEQGPQWCGSAIFYPMLGEGMVVDSTGNMALVDWGSQSSEMPIESLVLLRDVVTPGNVREWDVVIRRESRVPRDVAPANVGEMRRLSRQDARCEPQVDVVINRGGPRCGVVHSVDRWEVVVEWEDDADAADRVVLYSGNRFTLEFAPPTQWERCQNLCASGIKPAHTHVLRSLPKTKYVPGASMETSSSRSPYCSSNSLSKTRESTATVEPFRKEMDKLAQEQKRLYGLLDQASRSKTYMRAQLQASKKNIKLQEELRREIRREAKKARRKLTTVLGERQGDTVAGHETSSVYEEDYAPALL